MVHVHGLHNLNKACPKDTYPLPSIDKLMDGVSSFQLLSFLTLIQGTTNQDAPPKRGKNYLHH